MGKLTLEGNQVMLRRAERSDAQAIAYLLAESFHPPEEYVSQWLYPWIRMGMVWDMEGRLTSPSSTRYACLVILIRGVIVATVEVSQRGIPGTWWSSPEVFYIANLAVAPGWRRQGLARLLLNAVEQTIQSWQAPRVYLHVMAQNQAAVDLYKSLGYAVERVEQAWSVWAPRPVAKLLLSKWVASR